MKKLQLSPEIESVLSQFEDPIKMMIFILVLRNPGITSSQLKKRLIISGTKIFYYINQLVEHNPPIIYEAGAENVSEHLVRRKFNITPEIEEIMRLHLNPKQNPHGFKLYVQYLSLALQYHKIRVTKSHIEKNRIDDLPEDMVMFVDEDIAKELRAKIQAVFAKCVNKYRAYERIDAIRLCNYIAYADITPV